MKSFLFILLLSVFAPLQCFDYDKSNFFFVTRRDNKEAICITPYSWTYTTFPTFDLDKLQIPPSGFKYWDWLADWQMQNDTNVRRRSGKSLLIAGSQPFNLVTRTDEAADVFILASNVSLWMTEENRARRAAGAGGGLLLEWDHLNETTKLKDTTLKFCTRNPEKKKANCTILDYKNGTNLLNDGNHWTWFMINFKENRTGVEMFDRSYRKEKSVVQCTWKNANISNPLTSDDFKVFAKSHQRNAAFYHPDDGHPNLANNKEMKRNYTKRSSGKLCVDVWWNKKRSNDPNEMMEVKNLASGRVQPPTNTTHGEYWPPRTYFQWNHLDAGEYEFTVRFDKRQPEDINLCAESGSKIWRTWVSMPKAITKCQFRVGYFSEYSAGPSSPPDPTLKPKWTLEEWEHVCDRLGIGSNDTEVQIKFCDWKGCNFSKCPHLQDEPTYIFDF